MKKRRKIQIYSTLTAETVKFLTNGVFRTYLVTLLSDRQRNDGSNDIYIAFVMIATMHSGIINVIKIMPRINTNIFFIISPIYFMLKPKKKNI